MLKCTLGFKPECAQKRRDGICFDPPESFRGGHRSFLRQVATRAEASDLRGADGLECPKGRPTKTPKKKKPALEPTEREELGSLGIKAKTKWMPPRNTGRHPSGLDDRMS